MPAKNTPKRGFLRAAAGLLALAALTLGAPPASAAQATADPMTEFEITLDGDKIGDGEEYGGPVTVNIQLASNSEDYTLWIDDAGVWKLVSPNDGGYQRYSLPFSADGEYDLDFRVENKKTLEKTLDSVSFTIAASLAAAVRGIDTLPDPDDASDGDITSRRTEIVSLVNSVNSLPSGQRDDIADAKLEKLDALLERLAALDPETDANVPAAVTANLQGESVEYGALNFYAGKATLSASGAGNLLMRSGGDWAALEGGSAEFTEPGEYHVDVLAESASGLRGPSVSFDFVVDPDIPNFIEETERLYTTAQSIDQSEYVTSLERLYKQYLEMSPLRQSLIPTRTRDRMIYMHDFILEQLKFSNVVEDPDGRDIMAIGMYAALNIPAIHLASDEVSLVAERADPPAELPEGTQGRALAEYRIAFACPGMEEDDLPIEPAQPIKICLQIPDDLRNQKNIDILYLEDGQPPASMGARVRSTEDNLIVYFNTTKSGRFVFVADAAQS